MPAERDYYEVLGVSPAARPEEIRRAFRAKALEHHPDVAADKDRATRTFPELLRAFEALSDPVKRRWYDYRTGRRVRLRPEDLARMHRRGIAPSSSRGRAARGADSSPPDTPYPSRAVLQQPARRARQALALAVVGAGAALFWQVPALLGGLGALALAAGVLADPHCILAGAHTRRVALAAKLIAGLAVCLAAAGWLLSVAAAGADHALGDPQGPWQRLAGSWPGQTAQLALAGAMAVGIGLVRMTRRPAWGRGDRIGIGGALTDLEARYRHEYALLLVAAAAGLTYGLLSSQAAATIAPEYFATRSGLATPAPEAAELQAGMLLPAGDWAVRAAAAADATQHMWTLGLLAGVAVVLGNAPNRRQPQLASRPLYALLTVVLLTAACFGACLSAAGWLGWRVLSPPGVSPAEACVRGLRLGEYLGGLIAAAAVLVYVAQRRDRLARRLRTAARQTRPALP